MGNVQQKSDEPSMSNPTGKTIPPENHPADYHPKCFPPVKIPRDSEGFCQSFSTEQVEQYKRFFDEYGFVVIDKVLNKEECKAAINEIWEYLDYYSKQSGDKVEREDPTTWTNDSWPGGNLGILGHGPAFKNVSWEIRQNPRVYQPFADVMGIKELWASVDRYGVMRPTRNVPTEKIEEGKEIIREDRLDWKTVSNWLHWDLNPWHWTKTKKGNEYEFYDFIVENNGSKNEGLRKLQGLISLVEFREEDGGFCTVPSFHKNLKEWAESTMNSSISQRKQSSYDFLTVPKEDPMQDQIEKVPMREGSLLIWSSEQPHCNYPNDSDRFRMNFYLKYFPAHEGATGTVDRRNIIQEVIEEGKVNLTPLGRKLMGIDSWK